VVANDHTVRAGSTILQLPPGPGRRGYAGKRVELQLRLDGRLVVWERELVSVAAPADPVHPRSLHAAKPELGGALLSAARWARPDHPWRDAFTYRQREQARLTKSVSS
jgi:hypothetical protein